MIDQALINRWLNAYKKLNPMDVRETKVIYSKGWYYIDNGLHQENFRHKQLIEMADRLEQRLNQMSIK